MHIQRCWNSVFATNPILGSRMTEFCQIAIITGNLVDGFNGSRIVSVEKNCADVTMTGNVFINNTTKNDPDPRLGRIACRTAQPGQFPDLYFTLYDPAAACGPVIVKDNIFQLGDHCPVEAVTFAPNGRDLIFTDNTFQNKRAVIVVDPACARGTIEGNLGAKTVKKPVDFNHGRR